MWSNWLEDEVYTHTHTHTHTHIYIYIYIYIYITIYKPLYIYIYIYILYHMLSSLLFLKVMGNWKKVVNKTVLGDYTMITHILLIGLSIWST